jgi:hypothetical protein
MNPSRLSRGLLGWNAASLLVTLAGCSAFVGPNPANAPLRASLAAEALYAGPLRSQPKELTLLGTPCQPARDPGGCRLGDPASSKAASILGLTVVTPSEGGASLRAPWIRWTQLYHAWDGVSARTDRATALLWDEGEKDDYTPLFTAFRSFAQVARAETVLDQNRLRYELAARSRAVLVGRIRDLLRRREEPGADRGDIERQIRAYLELLSVADQRADERVRKLDALAAEEAELYATLAEATRTLDGLQRNITNHLLKLDLVLSAEEAKARAEATQDRLKRIRESIDAGRRATIEEAAKAKPPEWADRLREVLDELRPKRKE